MVKCSTCGKRAAIQLKYSGADLCEACFCRMFEKRVMKANRDFGLLKRGDTVVAGVSGGKDSSAMLACLAALSKRIGFTVKPVLIDEGIKGYRDRAVEKAEELCESLGLPLSIYPFKEHFGLSLDEIVKKKTAKAKRGAQVPGACSYCGVLRRRLLNKAAKELGATKVAVGHNADDAGQTLLLNLLRNDSNGLERFGPLSASDQTGSGFVPRIRPLLYNLEKECALYCVAKGIPFFLGECPYSESAMRGPVKDFLNEMEVERPGTKFTLLNSLLGMGKAPAKGKSIPAKTCRECGEPSSGGQCRACSLLSGLA